MTMTYNQLSASDEKMKTKIIPSTEHCYVVSLNLYIFQSSGTYAVTSLMVGAVVQEKADLFLRPPRSTTTMAPPIASVINSTVGTTYSMITANTTAVPLISTTRHHPTAADLTDDELRVRVGLAMSVTFMAGLIQVRVLDIANFG